MFSALSPFVVVFALFGPGVIFAGRREQTDWLTFACDTLLAASLVDSAIYWLVPLRAVPLWLYVSVLIALAVAGAVRFAAIAPKIGLPRLDTPGRRLVSLAIGLTIVAYAAIALTRAQIDWDAITYYLFTAVGFTVSGHVSALQSSSVTIGARVPMAFPPVLPTMYAEALTLNDWLHGTADQAVRLIPYCFLCGAAAATARLSRRFMPSIDPALAALAFLLMPLTINYMVAQALSLDMLSTFAFVLLLIEMLGDGTTERSGARIGLAASLAVLSKVTGPILVVFAIAAFAPAYLGTRAARALTALVAILLIASTWYVNPTATEGPWFYLACALFGAIAVSGAQKREPSPSFLRTEFAATAASLLPAAVYIVAASLATGSPATFYISSLVHTQTPNFTWANQHIVAANVFDSQNMPGLPILYGLDVLFNWGFSPPFMTLVLAGIALALRSRDRACAVLVPLALLELAFMTLFGEGDFRRLLPVVPLTAVIGVYAASKLPFLRRAPAIAVCAVLALGFPYAWTAQQTIYAVPIQFLNGLAFDQWHGSDGDALINTFLYICATGVAVLAMCGVWCATQRATRVAIAAVATTLFVIAAILAPISVRPALALLPIGLVLGACVMKFAPIRGRIGVALATAAIVALVVVSFVPVVLTGVSPGFVAWANEVSNNQYYGYLAALRDVSKSQKAGSVLTFEGYGVTWFTNGQLRRVELVDAFDLGLLRAALGSHDSRTLLAALHRYGVKSAILPAPGGPMRPEFDRLLKSAHLTGLTLLDNPSIATRQSGDAWNVYRIRDVRAESPPQTKG
jgi:hypothetical protein